MASQVLGVAIAGLGRAGYDIHARWLRQATDQYRIVAVADGMAERCNEAAEALGCKAYSDYRKLLGHKGVDVFINALPNHLHPKVTCEAFRAGHHVVCEKPLAIKVRDMDRMIAAARGAKRVLAPFQNGRFGPMFAKIQEVIASGVLGELLHVRLFRGGFGRRWDWQTRQDLWGGSLNNIGSHLLDHAVMLFGGKTPKVFAKLLSGPGTSGDADDFAAVTLHGPGSPTVEVLLSAYSAYAPAYPYLVNGSCGGLAGGKGELRWRYFHPAAVDTRTLDTGWSVDRRYCNQPLEWTERTWQAPKAEPGVAVNTKAFYDNLYDVLTAKGKLVVTPAQVRKQVAVVEEAHRQNRLPKMKTPPPAG